MGEDEKKQQKTGAETLAGLMGAMQQADKEQQQQFYTAFMQMQQELLTVVGKRIDRVEEDVRDRAKRIDDEIRRVENERRDHTREVDRTHYDEEKKLENKIEGVEKNFLQANAETGKDVASLQEKATALDAKVEGKDTLVDPATGKPLPYYKQPSFWLSVAKTIGAIVLIIVGTIVAARMQLSGQEKPTFVPTVPGTEAPEGEKGKEGEKEGDEREDSASLEDPIP
jgi:hypothetical protein